MRRPAQGGTRKPGPCRPASGYGKQLGRPGPRVTVAAREPLEPELRRHLGEGGGEAGRAGPAPHRLRGHEAGEVPL